MALTQHDDAEFRRIVSSLISEDRAADWSGMATPEIGAGDPSLTPVRVAALVGAVLAVVLVVLAFALNPVAGFVMAALSPAVPLAVAVAADRLRSR
jgi:hypothetical protein